MLRWKSARLALPNKPPRWPTARRCWRNWTRNLPRGAQNWQALRALERVVALGPRVLVGTSRKRFLAEVLTDAEATATAAAGAPGDAPSADAAPVDAARLDAARLDLATAVTSVLAAQAGVWAVRVHDVAATRDSLAVAHAWNAGVPAETTDARARTADARGGTR